MSVRHHTFQGPFELEFGGVLRDVKVAFHTYGTMQPDQSNVVFVAHALSGSSDASLWWPGFFEKNRFLDPDKNFVICMNNLGSPYGTTSPASINPLTGKPYGPDFPFFTIRDTARLHLLLLKELGIERINLLIGPSCGGHIAQEMAVTLGDRINYLALLCCAARESPWAVAIHESQRQALIADQTFGQPGGGQAGLAAARGIALPYYRTQTLLNQRQAEESNDVVRDYKAASYIRYQGQKFVQRFDPYCYYHLMNALDTHNIGRGHADIPDALAQIKARTLCMSFSTDLMVPASEQAYLAKHIPAARHVEIDTIYGHDAFLIETDKIHDTLAQYLQG